MHIWKMNFFFALRTLRFLYVHFPKAELGIQAFISQNRNSLYGPLFSPPKPSRPSLPSPVTPSEQTRDLQKVSFLSLSHSQGMEGVGIAPDGAELRSLPDAQSRSRGSSPLSPLVTDAGPEVFVRSRHFPVLSEPIGAPSAALIVPN